MMIERSEFNCWGSQFIARAFPQISSFIYCLSFSATKDFKFYNIILHPSLSVAATEIFLVTMGGFQTSEISRRKKPLTVGHP